jgi:hypothetical protein
MEVWNCCEESVQEMMILEKETGMEIVRSGMIQTGKGQETASAMMRRMWEGTEKCDNLVRDGQCLGAAQRSRRVRADPSHCPCSCNDGLFGLTCSVHLDP